jgi:hypothetical protein
MDYVIGISWPRSGHHMLVRLLHLYFGSDFGYCDYYGHDKTCCRTVPCQKAGQINFTKNHDFALDTPQIPDQKYLIQYRDFLPSVISNYELFIRQGGEDSRTAFCKFASTEFGRYQGFVRKWITSEFGQRQLILNYADFLDDPEGHLAKVILYMGAGKQLNLTTLRDAIEQVDGEKVEQHKVQQLKKSGVHVSRDVTAFRYYDKNLFAQLKALSLTREEVNNLFSTHLGREAAEDNMIHFQAFRNGEVLEQYILDSPEYAARAKKS